MTMSPPRPDTQPAARQIFKMRELSLHTAQVMKEISESGEPALITLRGRFVAVITPLTGGELESKLISAALAEGAAGTSQFLGEQPTSYPQEEPPPQSTEEVAQELGIDVPDYGDRDPAE